MELTRVEVRENKEARPGRPIHTRVYIFHTGESLLENMQNRFARPKKLYYKMLAEIARRAELDVEQFVKNARWSQKAGCQCGCSPGFIVKGMYNLEIFVDVKE